MTEDFENPFLDPDDVEPSRIFLTQGLSEPVKEGKIGVGRYYMAPDEVELTLDKNTPGFRFVVLCHIKDRPMWMGGDDARRIGCLGQMDRTAGEWRGQILLDPDRSDIDANYLEELKSKNAGGTCATCQLAGDIREAPRDQSLEWKDMCKFRWRYAIWIVDGLPEDYIHPPFVSFDLLPMPGRDGAKTLTTKLTSYIRQGLYARTYRAIKPALGGAKGKEYFKWAFRDDGKTPDDVLMDIKERVMQAKQIMTMEPAKQIATATEESSDSERNLPF